MLSPKYLAAFAAAMIVAVTASAQKPAANQTSGTNKTSSVPYNINGSLTGFKAPFLYFESLGLQTVTKLDSAKNKDGKFVFAFKGTASEPGLYRLRTGSDFDQTLMFILSGPNNNIVIQGDSASLPAHSYKVMGSQSSEQMRGLLQDAKQRFARYNDANAKTMNPSLSAAERTRLTQEAQAIADANRKYYYAYTDTVKNPVLMVFSAISFLEPQGDILQLKKVRERLDAQKATFVLAKQYNDYVAANADAYEQGEPQASFKVGDVLPDIVLKDTSGNEVKLSSLRGKYVLVDFWASWCGPCRVENPNLVTAHNRFKDKGFEVFGVSLDTDRTRWAKAIRSDKLNWPNVSELKGWNSAVCQQFSVFSIPANYLIDPQGRIVAVNLRGEDLQTTLASVIK